MSRVDVDYFCPAAYPVMLDPTAKYAWIDIPKCASSFIQKVLFGKANYRKTNLYEDTNLKSSK